MLDIIFIPNDINGKAVPPGGRKHIDAARF
jgi:hypothetical protein